MCPGWDAGDGMAATRRKQRPCDGGIGARWQRGERVEEESGIHITCERRGQADYLDVKTSSQFSFLNLYMYLI